jgi:mRNA-degrading endonuclease YafQ of YafQ-DinJ toxin-antitoxin module
MAMASRARAFAVTAQPGCNIAQVARYVANGDAPRYRPLSGYWRFIEAIDLLPADRLLPQRYFDHPLSGGMERLPRLLIKPDLVLINDKPDAHTLRLMRLGSDSEPGF